MINNFSISCQLGDDRQPIGPHQTVMALTPQCEQIMQARVFPFFKVEVMQGSRRVLTDGRIEYSFELDDDKARLLRQALVSVIYPTTNN